ncbi:MAG: hypothetical protein ACR5LC_13605 [Symbiopectobacterium sp.]
MTLLAPRRLRTNFNISQLLLRCRFDLD